MPNRIIRSEIVTSDKRGWIYVLDDHMGHFKIGCAAVLDKRIKQLAIQLPFSVSIAYCFQADAYQAVERDLHRHFKHRRLKGEWFELDTEDFAHIHGVADCAGYYELPSGEMVRDRFYGLSESKPEISLIEWLEEHMEELEYLQKGYGKGLYE